MNILNLIKKILGKEDKLDYPNEFFIVEYSPSSLENNIKTNHTKVIHLFTYDELGNKITKKIHFSPEKVFSLENVHKIPGFDRTKKFHTQKLPIFSEILPMEVNYEV